MNILRATMFRLIRKTSIAFSTVVMLGAFMLAPQDAFARGFGFGGIAAASAYGAAFNGPIYVEPPRVYYRQRPIIVEAPIRHRRVVARRDATPVAARPIAQPPDEMARAVTPPLPTPPVTEQLSISAPPPAPAAPRVKHSVTIIEDATPDR